MLASTGSRWCIPAQRGISASAEVEPPRSQITKAPVSRQRPKTTGTEPGTLAHIGVERLSHLLDTLDFPSADIGRATSIFETLAVPWGSRLIHRRAPFASDITDDHTPFEMSVAIDRGTPEARF